MRSGKYVCPDGIDTLGVHCRSAPTFHTRRCPPISGFTLIELLVVMAVLATLISLVAPRYLDRVDHAREVVLREDLRGLRVAIDQFFRDQSRYPQSLGELVERRYIRDIPKDPLTGRADTWVIVAPKDATSGVFDVHSGAAGHGRDGSEYAQW